MKTIVIPQSECDYFMILEESEEFALVFIKGFEFIVMNQDKFLRDVKTGNLHEVTLEIHGETGTIHYQSHSSLDDVKQEEETNYGHLVHLLAAQNINLN